jgi:SNF2 family DNA or RNA helicase
MKGVHEVLYNEYASRMKIKDLGDLFPENKVLAQCYDMKNHEEIEKQYKIIEEEVELLKSKEENSGCALTRILYARMRIEALKMPTFVEMTKALLEEEKSVAIFVNFTQTLKMLAEELDVKCLVYGEQTLEERNKNIDDFNNDSCRIIICNIRSGGVGISLHDLHGKYPRVSLISPSWSAQDTIQALGRIHRAKGKTPVIQRIIFCSQTVEEKVCNNMKEKIINIGQLNDGNNESYIYEGLTDDKEVCLDEELTEFELLFRQITALNHKRERLEEDLKNTKKEIDTLTLQLSRMN